jgi:hypothetical protein
MDIESRVAFLKESGYYDGNFDESFRPNQKVALDRLQAEGLLRAGDLTRKVDMDSPEYAEDIKMLSTFMTGPDMATYGRMIGFFSVPRKYVHPREIWRFRNSMSDEEWTDFKVEFWSHMVNSGQVAAAVI